MFENVTFKTDPLWRAKAEGLNQTQSVGTSIVIGSFLRSASNSDNVIVSLDRKRRRHMASELEENGNVQILLTTDSAAH